jgi:hypothetical protein
MFSQIQMHNDKALVTRVSLEKLILGRLPHKVFERMHTVNLSGRTDDEIIKIIIIA